MAQLNQAISHLSPLSAREKRGGVLLFVPVAAAMGLTAVVAGLGMFLAVLLSSVFSP